MKKLIFSVAFFWASFPVASSAIAGTENDVRDFARSEAVKLRGEGWPKENCFAGIYFSGNTVLEGNGVVLAGDKLLSIDGASIENLATNEISQAFKSIEPDSLVPIQLRRSGELQKVDLKCGNSADYQRVYLKALDFAGNKKWDDCVDALSTDFKNALFVDLRVRCARTSRKAKNYPIQQWVDASYSRRVEMARYAEALQREVALVLLKSRLDISPTIYDDLVEKAKAWGAGQTWALVQPDYEAMRNSAARAVRSRLIDPDSAIIEMPFDFVYGSWRPALSRANFEGYMTCGTVNAKNRMGGYTGKTYFISVVDQAGFDKFTDMDDAKYEYYRPVTEGCLQLITKLKLLPPSSQKLDSPKNSSTGALSVAEQLEKLAKLHSSGALSDSEYAAAKAKVLSGN